MKYAKPLSGSTSETDIREKKRKFITDTLPEITALDNQVTSINLTDNEIGAEGAFKLADALRNPNCKLTSINLIDNEIGAQGAAALAGALRDPNCKLTSINLDGNKIRYPGAAALADALKDPNCKLTSINLDGNEIGADGAEGAAALADALKDPNCKLTSISFRNNQIGAEGAAALAGALRDPNCKLTSINLDGNQIGAEGAAALADALRDPNCKLTSISFWINQIGAEGAAALADALKDPNCKLTSIDLFRNKIGADGAAALAGALRDPNCKLTSINLDGNQIRYPGAAALAGALKDLNCKLTSISFRNNQIGAEGAFKLADALRDPNCKLTSINLDGNQIGAEGAAALADALRDPNCKLTSINLTDNEIGPQGAAALAGALRDLNCKLTSIGFRINQIGAEGAAALAGALRDPNCKLTSIDLFRNQIGPQGAAALADALEDPNCKLTSIDLEGNKIDERTLDKIRTQLQLNQERIANEQNPTNQSSSSSSATREAAGKQQKENHYSQTTHNIEAEIKRQLDMVEIKKVREPNSLELAQLQHDLGKIYQLNNDSEKALEQYRNALKIRQKSPESAELSESYRAIGNIFFAKNLRKEALVHFNNAKEIDENLKIENFANAETIFKIGEIYLSFGDKKTALQELEKSYKTLQLLDSDDIIRAKCAFRIGEILRSQEDFIATAEEKLNEALTLTSNKSPKSLLEADILFNLGEIHRFRLESGEEIDDKQALDFHKKAFLIRKLKEPDGLPISDSYLCLGKIYARCGELGTTLTYFQRSADIKDKNVEGVSAEIADILSAEIADIYFEIGLLNGSKKQHLEAEQAFRKSLEIRNKLNPNSDGVGLCYESIGHATFAQGDENKALKKFEEALKNFEEALKIRAAQKSATTSEAAKIYFGIAAVYKYKKEPKKEISNLISAYGIIIKIPDSAKEASKLALIISNKFYDLGLYKHALQYTDRIIESNQANIVKGKILTKLGEFSKAFAAINSSLARNPTPAERKEAKKNMIELVEHICANGFLDLGKNEDRELFNNILPTLRTLENEKQLITSALANDKNQERKANNLAFLITQRFFGYSLSIDETANLFKEADLDQSQIKKTCQKIYSSREDEQVNLFRKAVEIGVVNELQEIKKFAASLEQKDNARKIINDTGNPLIRFQPSDIAEIEGTRLKRKYPHLAKLLDISITESFSDAAKTNILTAFDPKISDQAVMNFLAYRHFQGHSLTESAQMITSYLNSEAIQRLANPFLESDAIPYINVSESTALQNFIGNLEVQGFQKIELISNYIKSKLPEILPLNATEIDDYTLGMSDGKRSQEQEAQLNQMFRNILRENPLLEESFMNFFNQAFEIQAGTISEFNKSKLSNFFIENKKEVVHVFQQTEGLDKFGGLMMSVLGDGCVANISTQFRITLYNSILEDPCDQILYSTFSEKIIRPILNFEGADRLGSDATRDNVLDHTAINLSFISPAGLIKDLKEEFYKDGVHIRNAREFIIQASRRGNANFGNLAFLEDVSDEQAAELAVKSVLENTVHDFSRNVKFAEFTRRCAEIEERARNSNASTNISPRNAIRLTSQNLENSH